MKGGRGVELSVVVPAFDEEPRIARAVRELTGFLRHSGLSWELIVVDDGSTDATSRILRDFAKRERKLRVFRASRNRGKGAAIRQGLRHARGRAVVFTDCDLATPPAELRRATRLIGKGYDLAIGSRAVSGARIEVPSPLLRRLASRAFHCVVRVLLGLPYADTQCGFKAFSRRAAGILAREGKIDGFTFDLEFLLLARRHGMRVTEFPIVWRDQPSSKVRLLRHVPAMFLSLFLLKRRFPREVGFHPVRMLPLIAFSVLCAITAQILFKHGAISVGGGLGWDEFLPAILMNHWIWMGVASYGLSAIAWLTVLAKVDLSFAFPMLSLGFVFAALYAHTFLDERLGPNRVLGIALVVLGVLVISASGQTIRAGSRQ